MKQSIRLFLHSLLSVCKANLNHANNDKVVPGAREEGRASLCDCY